MEAIPLLKPGFHKLNDLELKSLCVSKFSSSKSRIQLYDNLILLLSRLRAFNTSYSFIEEIWIDGSYVTEKINPNDIDILLVINSQILDNIIPESIKNTLFPLLHRNYVKENFNVDLLILFRNNAVVNGLSYNEMRSYWRGWFSFDRHENPKGVVTLDVNG